MEALLDVGHDDTVAHRVDAHDEVGNVLKERHRDYTSEKMDVTNLLLTSNVCLFVNPTYYTNSVSQHFKQKNSDEFSKFQDNYFDVFPVSDNR